MNDEVTTTDGDEPQADEVTSGTSSETDPFQDLTVNLAEVDQKELEKKGTILRNLREILESESLYNYLFALGRTVEVFIAKGSKVKIQLVADRDGYIYFRLDDGRFDNVRWFRIYSPSEFQSFGKERLHSDVEDDAALQEFLEVYNQIRPAFIGEGGEAIMAYIPEEDYPWRSNIKGYLSITNDDQFELLNDFDQAYVIEQIRKVSKKAVSTEVR